MKTEEKVKEEKEYQRVDEGSEGYTEILMEANELVAPLETRLKVIARIGQQARAKVLSERETETTVNPSVRMQPGGYNNTELITRLISLSLGEHLRVLISPSCNCQCLMVTFNNSRNSGIYTKPSIHEQQTMPAVSKFSYLKSVLKGSALSAIAGIPLTSENYSLVVKLLQERFGQKEAIVESVVFQVTVRIL